MANDFPKTDKILDKLQLDKLNLDKLNLDKLNLDKITLEKLYPQSTNAQQTSASSSTPSSAASSASASPVVTTTPVITTTNTLTLPPPSALSTSGELSLPTSEPAYVLGVLLVESKLTTNLRRPTSLPPLPMRPLDPLAKITHEALIGYKKDHNTKEVLLPFLKLWIGQVMTLSLSLNGTHEYFSLNLQSFFTNTSPFHQCLRV